MISNRITKYIKSLIIIISFLFTLNIYAQGITSSSGTYYKEPDSGEFCGSSNHSKPDGTNSTQKVNSAIECADNCDLYQSTCKGFVFNTRTKTCMLNDQLEPCVTNRLQQGINGIFYGYERGGEPPKKVSLTQTIVNGKSCPTECFITELSKMNDLSNITASCAQSAPNLVIEIDYKDGIKRTVSFGPRNAAVNCMVLDSSGNRSFLWGFWQDKSLQAIDRMSIYEAYRRDYQALLNIDISTCSLISKPGINFNEQSTINSVVSQGVTSSSGTFYKEPESGEFCGSSNHKKADGSNSTQKVNSVIECADNCDLYQSTCKGFVFNTRTKTCMLNDQIEP